MRTSSLHYSEIDSDEGFKKFASLTGGQILDNSIFFTDDLRNGKVIRFKIEDGLSLKIWDINPLSMNFEFDKDAYTISNEKVFTLFILLTSNQILIKDSLLQKQISLRGSVSIPFLSNNTCFAVQACSGQPFKAIDISITSGWLKKQFSAENEELLKFIDTITVDAEPVMFLGSCSHNIYTDLNNFHQQALTGDKGMLYFRSKTLQVISDFFEQSIHTKKIASTHSHQLHHDQIIKAERMLTEHLTANLPSLHAIAKEIALSESTLRRHFKLLFGKNIYEYYLEKKMELAKQMILHESYNVNEVAAKLGYEKVSSFIDAFKKVHGISPGSIRKGHS